MGETLNTTIVPKQEVPMMLPRTLHLIKKALNYANGEYGPDHVIKGLMENRMQMWVVMDDELDVRLIVITQLAIFPAKRVCEIVLMAGHDVLPLTGSWVDEMDAEIEEWAILNGCSRLSAYVRPGVRRVLKDRGYRHLYDVIGKDLGVIH